MKIFLYLGIICLGSFDNWISFILYIGFTLWVKILSGIILWDLYKASLDGMIFNSDLRCKNYSFGFFLFYCVWKFLLLKLFIMKLLVGSWFFVIFMGILWGDPWFWILQDFWQLFIKILSSIFRGDFCPLILKGRSNLTVLR